MSKKNEPNDYEVGYRKPPKQSRWKPGQSGNPHGRRKLADNQYELIADIFRKPVKVKGAPEGASELDLMVAAILALAQRALKNDKTTLFSLIRLAMKEIPEPIGARKPTPEEKARSDRLMRNMFGIDPDTGADLWANKLPEERASSSE